MSKEEDSSSVEAQNCFRFFFCVIFVWCCYFATLKWGFCHSAFPVQGGAFIHMGRDVRDSSCSSASEVTPFWLCTKLSLVSTTPVKEELGQINSASALHRINKKWIQKSTHCLLHSLHQTLSPPLWDRTAPRTGTPGPDLPSCSFPLMQTSPRKLNRAALSPCGFCN